MGFLNDASSGYKKTKNVKGLTNDELCVKLGNAGLSFGEPKLGTISVLGKEKEAVVFNLGRFDVYVKADSKNIEVARVLGKNESKSENLAKELLASAVTDANKTDTAEADRAVDELFDVVEQILKTGDGVSKVAKADGESGEGSSLYMKQAVVTIRDKYSIYDKNQNVVYNVQGNITGLSFSIKNANDEPIYTIKKKLIAITPEYTIFRGDEKIGNIKKKIKITRAEISGEVNGKPVKISGDMSGYHFSIELGEKVIGSVDTVRLTWGDCYEIKNNILENQDLIVLIAVICDNSLKGKN